MDSRIETLQKWIDARKECDEITNMMFTISAVAAPCFDVTTIENKVMELLDRNGVGYSKVDTVSGAWNLNRDWIETDIIPCAVEYCGCYPVEWSIEDVAELERMENEGEIIIVATHRTDDGEYIPNH